MKAKFQRKTNRKKGNTEAENTLPCLSSTVSDSASQRVLQGKETGTTEKLTHIFIFFSPNLMILKKHSKKAMKRFFIGFSQLLLFKKIFLTHLWFFWYECVRWRITTSFNSIQILSPSFGFGYFLGNEKMLFGTHSFLFGIGITKKRKEKRCPLQNIVSEIKWKKGKKKMKASVRLLGDDCNTRRHGRLMSGHLQSHMDVLTVRREYFVIT